MIFKISFVNFLLHKFYSLRYTSVVYKADTLTSQSEKKKNFSCFGAGTNFLQCGIFLHCCDAVWNVILEQIYTKTFKKSA